MSTAYLEKQSKRDFRATERLIMQIAKEVTIKQRNGEPVDPEFEIPTRSRRDNRTDRIQNGNLSEYERGRLRKIKVIIYKMLEKSGEPLPLKP